MSNSYQNINNNSENFAKCWKIVGGDLQNKIQIDSTQQDYSNTYQINKQKNQQQQYQQIKQNYFKQLIYIRPLLVITLVISISYYLYNLSIQEQVKKQDTLNTFTILFCSLQIFSLLINLPTQLKFYSWWSTSGLTETKNRGLSTKGYKLFGFIKIPNIPKQYMLILALSYIINLLLTIYFQLQNQQQYSGYSLSISLILAIIYFSQLWAEQSAAYHRECLTITVLFYLSFTKTFFSNQLSLEQEIYVENFVIFCIKLHMASIYLASALQKLVCSFIQKDVWGSTTPLTQIYLAMWAKPYYRHIQKFLLTHPKLTQICGNIVHIIQATFILQFFFGFQVQIFFATAVIIFHTSVFIIQGIDYVTFWSPIFLLWFLKADLPEFNTEMLYNQNIYLPGIFLLIQLIYCFTFLEDLNINIPPFTCSPMFVYVTKIFQNSPQFYALWDMRSSLCMENLEWMQPFLTLESGLGVQEKDFQKIPFRFIGFGHYSEQKNYTDLQKQYFRTTLLNDKQGFFLYSNFELQPKLIQKLKDIVHFTQNGLDSYNKDHKQLNLLYEKYQEIYTLFINNLYLTD